MSEAAVCTMIPESIQTYQNDHVCRNTQFCDIPAFHPDPMNDECRYDGYARELPYIGCIRKPTAFVMLSATVQSVLVSYVHIFRGHAEMVQHLYDARRDSDRLIADIVHITKCVEASYMIIAGRTERKQYPSDHMYHQLNARFIRQICKHTSVLTWERFEALSSRFSPRIPGHDLQIWLNRTTRNPSDHIGNWGERGLMRTAAWADMALLLRLVVTPCR